MSKFVSEIIESLDNDPTKWTNSADDYGYYNVESKDVCIKDCGHGAILSIIKVYVKNSLCTTTYVDKFRLEMAVNRWFKNATVEMLEK